MTHATRLPAGQTTAAAPDPARWRVLDDLRVIAPGLGLGPGVLRTLQVLIGLVRPERGAFVVHAGNRTLCERLMGVSDRTVQRHVAALAASGLLQRQDSASRRRFRQSDDTCFGLDLRPLYARAAEIAAAAAAARAAAEALRNQRRVAMARLYAAALPDEARAPLARRLRRATTEAGIAAVTDLLPQPAALPDPNPDPDKMTPAPRQDDGPIPDTEEESLSVRTAENGSDLPLPVVLDACPEVRATFGHRPATWNEAAGMAGRLAGFIGIAPAGWQAARERMGLVPAVTALFVILQRLPLIRSPGAYLHGLVRRRDEGRLNLRAQLRHLLRQAAAS